MESGYCQLGSLGLSDNALRNSLIRVASEYTIIIKYCPDTTLVAVNAPSNDFVIVQIPKHITRKMHEAAEAIHVHAHRDNFF